MVLLVLLSGCFFAQSYPTGMAVICDAPKTCADCTSAAPEQQALLLSEHIQQQLYNREARKLLDGLAMVHYTKRGAALREAASEANLRECAFADVMDSLVAAEEE